MVLLVKKTAFAVALFLLLTIAAGTQIIRLTDANPHLIKPAYCNITIHSPQNIIYDTGSILLNFTLITNYFVPPESFYFYNLDGEDVESSVEIKDFQIIREENITDDTIRPYIEYTVRGQAELPLLSDGPHSVKFFAGYFYGDGIIDWSGSRAAATVWFIVDTPGGEPSASSVVSTLSNLSIVSPKNETYDSKFLTLNATIDFVLARIESMSYSIDGLGRYSFSNHFHSEDSTIIHGTQIWLAALPELAEGQHSIAVYLEGTLYFPDECHNSEQATVYFTMENPQSSPSPSPSPLSTPTPEPTPYEEITIQSTSQYVVTEGAVAVASIVVFLGLLFYFIKRK